MLPLSTIHPRIRSSGWHLELDVSALLAAGGCTVLRSTGWSFIPLAVERGSPNVCEPAQHLAYACPQILQAIRLVVTLCILQSVADCSVDNGRMSRCNHRRLTSLYVLRFINQGLFKIGVSPHTSLCCHVWNSTWVVALNYRESDDNAHSRIGEEYSMFCLHCFGG